MRYVVDAVQMKEIDRRTSEEIGIPPIVLMEKAAEQIVQCAVAMLANMGKYEKIPAKRGDCSCGSAGMGEYGSLPEKQEDCGCGSATSGNNRREAGSPGRVLAIYGAGGNGGDAVAAARLLHIRGFDVTILSADEKEPSALTKQECLIAEKCGVPEWEGTCNNIDFTAYDIILDGIFGIGLSREVTGEYRALIIQVNASKTPVLAIDIPSGIHAGTGECLGVAVKAEQTVTFGEYKVGHFLYPGAAYCGKLVLADAGFVPKICKQVFARAACHYMTYERADVPFLLPERVVRSHKGSYGKVLVWAGSDQVTGAAYLAAKAAYRCGVGLVKLVSTGTCLDVVRRMLPEAFCEEIPQKEQEEFWNRQVGWADAMLAGPGIGTGWEAAGALAGLLDAMKKNRSKTRRNAGMPSLVLDADALNLLAARCDLAMGGAATFQERLCFLEAKLPEGTILTPHPKELSRLSGCPVEQITEHLIDTAKQCGYNKKLVYVLKDAHTLVVYGDEIYINRSGCDGMATGGSGDVLAGIIAGLCVKKAPFAAAKAGVFLHGLAGERAQEKCGCRAMLAGDILDGMFFRAQTNAEEFVAGVARRSRAIEKEKKEGGAWEPSMQGYDGDGI